MKELDDIDVLNRKINGYQALIEKQQEYMEKLMVQWQS